ncbi:MAG: hypothetical protein ACREQA_08365 [Candidatus Binatia bacterium]
MTDTQKIIELTVFKEFAEICPYKIDPNSIEKRAGPEPDILCNIAGNGSVAFELGETVDAVFARQVDGGYKLQQKFDEACMNLPALRSSLPDAIVYVEFFDEVSDRVRVNALNQSLSSCIPWSRPLTGTCLYGNIRSYEWTSWCQAFVLTYC